MIDDRNINYEVEYKKVVNELSELKQKYCDLEDDRDYIKSLLDKEFKKSVSLTVKNKELKEANQSLLLKLIDILEFIKEKGIVTHEEVKKWWKNRVLEKDEY